MGVAAYISVPIRNQPKIRETEVSAENNTSLDIFSLSYLIHFLDSDEMQFANCNYF